MPHHAVVMQLKQLPASLDVPSACVAIDAARCHMSSVRAERQAPYQAGSRRQMDLSAAAQVKKAHAAIAPAREPAAIAAEGQCPDFVAVHHAETFFSRQGIRDPGGAIPTRSCEVAIIRTEGEVVDRSLVNDA